MSRFLRPTASTSSGATVTESANSGSTCPRTSAAARVHVRQPYGRVSVYRRAAGEPVVDFYRRLVALEKPDQDADDLELSAAPHLVAVLRGDFQVPPGSHVYAMDTRTLKGDSVRRLGAGDLVAELVRSAK